MLPTELQEKRKVLKDTQVKWNIRRAGVAFTLLHNDDYAAYSDVFVEEIGYVLDGARVLIDMEEELDREMDAYYDKEDEKDEPPATHT